MIFRPELVEKILAGEKTETRRPLKGALCRYEPGKTYAIQPGRGKPAVARMRVVAVRSELLGEISEEAAEREGFTPVNGRTAREKFLNYWLLLYGRLDEAQRVWAIRFEVVT